jgi:hypothetical protein
MPDVAGTFPCQACGRRFAWRPENAGKSGTCACGAKLVCPTIKPSASDNLYELAPVAVATSAPKFSAAVGALTVAFPATPNAGAASATSAAPEAGGRTLSYASPRRTKPDITESIQWQAPLWILSGGICVEMAAALLRGGSFRFIAEMQALGLKLLLSTALMLVAVLIATKARGIALGPFWLATLKLAALSVGPGALMDILWPLFVFIPFGGLIGLVLEFVLFFALLGFFFNLDESDTWYCLCVMFIVDVTVSLAFSFL